MSVRVSSCKRRPGRVEVDIRWQQPDGKRRRKKTVVQMSKSEAKRWGEKRVSALRAETTDGPTEEVPTLEGFAPRFIDGYAVANRQKPSGIAAKQSILQQHLLPRLGRKRLDAIRNEDVQQLKQRLRDRSVKTVNNVLTVLNTLLKVAVEWGVIAKMPCTVRLLRVPGQSAAFHVPAEFERLVEAAERLDAESHLIVLLGGEAGLRCGEMMALEWRDVDFVQWQIRVERSIWKGQVTATKGGRVRFIRMTARLRAALARHRSLKSQPVLAQRDGQPLTQKMVQRRVQRAAARAGVQPGVHILRHTFCSRLAMAGAPPCAIQKLAGHQHLGTTQRYMHVSPAATASAVRLLEGPVPHERGDIGETAIASA